MTIESHGKSTQAPQAKIDVLRPHTEAKVLMRLGDRGGSLLRRGDRTEHDVGMTADIFGCSLDGNICTVGKRLEVKRRCPGIVQNDHRAGSMGWSGDRRNVLDLERLRTR